jgi:hypothetical protein
LLQSVVGRIEAMVCGGQLNVLDLRLGARKVELDQASPAFFEQVV